MIRMLALVSLVVTVTMITAVAPQQAPDGDTIPLSPLFPAQDGSVPCNPNICRLPWCYCSGTAIPGNLDPRATPQIVMLTFQNAVNVQNFELYQRLFRGRRNPNGCPASGTFFVSHNYTDYFYVQSLYSQRHEIGDNTVTSQTPAGMAGWYNELTSERAIISSFGGVKSSDVIGVRAAGLKMGGDDQFTAMYKAGFVYDASRMTEQFSDKNNFLWPYTYDYPSTQDCINGPCPSGSYPGIWQIPLPYLKDSTGRKCVTTQGCFNVNTAYDAFQLLNDTFTAHYTSNNRAPLIIPVDTAWLMTDYKMAGTLRFLDVLSTMRDVYLVTASQAIAWCRKPTPLYSISSFQPWKCSTAPPSVCEESRVNNCYYDDQRRATSSAAAVWRMRTCSTCPRCYPAVNDPYGSFC